MNQDKIKRTWYYVQKPAEHEISCPQCKGNNLEWSEFQGHVWCYNCKIDFDNYISVLSGPTSMEIGSLLGICFDRYNMDTNDVDYYDFAKREYVKKTIEEYKNLKTNNMEENKKFLNGEAKAQDASLTDAAKQNTAAPKKERKPRVKKADIPITPSTEVTPVDDRITQELVKHNITEAVLTKMETDFLSLTITDVNDKDGYKAVHEARIACKNTRVLAVKLCKDGRAAAIKEQKDWIQTEDRIETRIKAVEDTLAARQKVIDDIKEAEKLERETKEQARLNERAVKLIGLGMNFDGTSYVLDDIKISVVQVKQLDEFVFGTLLAGVETKFKENQELKRQEEEKRLEAEAANKLLIEAQLQKEEELKLKEQEIARREEAIKAAEAKAKSDAEAKIAAEELAVKQKAEAELARIEKEEQDKLKTRRSALFALGFSQRTDNKLTFHGIEYSDAELLSCSTWDTVLKAVGVQVEQIKEKLLVERVEREERIKAEAIELEKKRAAEEAQAEAVAAQEEKEAREKEALRVAMLLPDIEKFNNFCKVIASVPVPQFSSPAYVNFAETIKADVLSILKTLHFKKPV